MPHRRIQDVLAFACLLNLFTFYPFFLPGMLLTEFSKNLPSSFLFSMSSFLIGFVVRPLGAYCLGIVADRRSRLLGLRLSVMLVGTASCLVCLIPDSEHWSYYVLRTIQGFALGGCYPILGVIIYETAPSSRRGLYTGIFQTSVPAGYLFAIAVTIVSRMIVGEESFLAEGWRIAFVYSGLMFPAWWQLNKLLVRVEQDGGFASEVPTEPWSLKDNKKTIAFLLLATAVGSIAITGVNIKGFFLKSLLKMDSLTANHIIAYSTIFYAPTYALWGVLSDKVGAYKVSTLALIAGIVLIFPLFKMFEIFADEAYIRPFSNSWFFIFLTSIAVSIIATACFGPFVKLICDNVHSDHRCTIYGLAYNVATGIVGGSAYLVSFMVYEKYGSLYGGIGYILIVASLSGIAAVIYCAKNKKHFLVK